MQGVLPRGYEFVERADLRPRTETFVRHVASGDLFVWDDGNVCNYPLVVRIKCVAIPCGMILYLPLKILRDTGMLIKSAATHFYEVKFVEVLKDVGNYVFDRVRDPYFAGCILLISIFGIFFPYEARSEIGKFERVWHHVDLTLDPHCYAEAGCKKGSLFDQEKVFYIAFCFQLRGNSRVEGGPGFQYRVVPAGEVHDPHPSFWRRMS